MEGEAEPGDLLAMEEPLAAQAPTQDEALAGELRVEVGETIGPLPWRAQRVRGHTNSITSGLEEKIRRADPTRPLKEEPQSDVNINQDRSPPREEPLVDVKEEEGSNPLPPGSDAQGNHILLLRDAQPLA